MSMTLSETLTAGWHVQDDARVADPEAGVAGDFALLEKAAEGRLLPTLRLWENRQCLVVSRRDARLPGFEDARRRLAAEGWPVIVRQSGGTAVPHSAGGLLVSLVYSVPAKTTRSIEDGYRRLCDLMIAGLARLGVRAETRAVPAAFCDGRYNLAVGPQKIAGTAQRWRRRRTGETTHQAVLAHALLLVDGDAAEMTAAVNRFYALAGADIRFDAESLTTLARCLGHPPGLMDRTREALTATAEDPP